MPFLTLKGPPLFFIFLHSTEEHVLYSCAEHNSSKRKPYNQWSIAGHHYTNKLLYYGWISPLK